MPPRGFPKPGNPPPPPHHQQQQQQQQQSHEQPHQQQPHQQQQPTPPGYVQQTGSSTSFSSLQQHQHVPSTSFQRPSGSGRSVVPLASAAAASSSSLSHAFDMPSPRKQHHESSYHDNNSSSTSSTGNIWLHSTQQPVTDEELNDLLASRPWRHASQVDMDESFEDMLSLSSSTPAWPHSSNIASLSDQDILWTAPHPTAAENAHLSGLEQQQTGMQFNMNDTTAHVLYSDSSLPPSYTNSPFHHTNLKSNNIGNLSNDDNVDQYTHSSVTQPQTMPFTMTTPNNFTSALLDHDPLSSPEDNLLQSLHLQQRHYPSTISNTSPISLQDHLLQQRSKQQQHYMQGNYPTSSISSSSTLHKTSRSGASNLTTTSGSGSVQPASNMNRPRAGTFIPSSKYFVEMRPRLSSSSSTGTLDKIQESSAMNFATGITTSLSAELAGLGINVADFPMDTQPLESTEMQRNNSSSSSSTTRTRRVADQTENSFFSQTTSSLDSSGLDDSLLSVRSNTQNNSRWIHGKDTPPSSPAPSLGSRTRTSLLSDQRIGKLSTSASLRYPSSSPYSRVDELGKSPVPSLDWSSTWPRVSMGHTDSTNSRSSLGLSNEMSPTLDSRRNRLVPSPSNRSFQDRRIKRHSRGFSSGHSLEAIDDGGVSSHFMKSSNESLQSDIGPSRSSRVTTESSESRRMKRMSASFMSEQEARRLHQEKQIQYDQVSDALNTLRRFLRQRDDGSSITESPSSSQSSRPTSYAGGSGQRAIPSLGEQVSSMLTESSNSRYAASSRRQRTLRHPPTGPLPPRGSIYTSPLIPTSNVSLPGQEGSRVEAERIAALEDLAKRVRQMKDENQLMLDDL